MMARTVLDQHPSYPASRKAVPLEQLGRLHPYDLAALTPTTFSPPHPRISHTTRYRQRSCLISDFTGLLNERLTVPRRLPESLVATR